jgi:hypothetical protein
MKTIDAMGETLEQAIEGAQEASNLYRKTVMVGRLYVSARRWVWGERFDAGNGGLLDDGSRWEPVRAVEPRI